MIDSAWLKVRLGQAGMVIVDLGSAAGLTRSGFRHGHRRGSVYSDYRGDGWRVVNAEGAPDMLAPAERPRQLVGDPGIDNSTTVMLGLPSVDGLAI